MIYMCRTRYMLRIIVNYVLEFSAELFQQVTAEISRFARLISNTRHDQDSNFKAYYDYFIC